MQRPLDLPLSNPIDSANRLVTRTVLLQVAGVIGISVAALALGSATARAVAVGGLIVVLGTAVFGWRLAAPGVAPVGQRLVALFSGVVLKWGVVILGLWFALAVLQLEPLALIAGVFAAQLAYWLGIFWFG